MSGSWELAMPKGFLDFAIATICSRRATALHEKQWMVMCDASDSSKSCETGRCVVQFGDGCCIREGKVDVHVSR